MGFRIIQEYETVKYSNNPPGGGEQKALVNFKDFSFSLVMLFPTEEWGDPPYPGIMF